MNKEKLVENITKEIIKLNLHIARSPKAKSDKDTYIAGFAKGQLSVYQKLIIDLKSE